MDIPDFAGVARMAPGDDCDAQIGDAIAVIALECEVVAELRRVGLQDCVEGAICVSTVRTLPLVPYGAAGICLSIQALMSAITPSLPTSLRRSWKCPS